MKKFYFVILTALILFSCKGTPEVKDETPVADASVKAEQPVEVTEEQKAEQIDEAGTDETAVAETEEPEEIDEIDVVVEADTEETEIAEQPSLPPPSQLQTPPAQLPVIPQPPPPPVPIQTLPEVIPPPQLQTPPMQIPVIPPRQTPFEPIRPLPEVVPPDMPPHEIAEDAPEEETPPPPPRRIPDLPQGPATRLDSLAQMGMTPLDTEIIFSRVVRATVGQILEIPFRGNGWVYLGELASRRGVAYNSRRNDSDGQTFIFNLEEAGTYTLKFYRQDFVRDYILNDHVQVIVGEAPQAGAGWFNAPVDRGRVVAQPRWPSALEEAQIRSGAARPSTEPVVTVAPPVTRPSAPSQRTPPAQSSRPETSAPQRTTPPQAAAPVQPQQQTSIPASGQPASGQTTAGQETSSAFLPPAQISDTGEQVDAISPQVTEALPPDVLIKRAQETFDGGNVAEAIALLDQFMSRYPSGSDEAYWLLGQFYEANSPSRNILLSLDYYRRLTNEYPQSRRFNDARRRIAYLERFFINIH